MSIYIFCAAFYCIITFGIFVDKLKLGAFEDENSDQATFISIFWPLVLFVLFIKVIKRSPKLPGFLLSGAKKTLKGL